MVTTAAMVASLYLENVNANVAMALVHVGVIARRDELDSRCSVRVVLGEGERQRVCQALVHLPSHSCEMVDDGGDTTKLTVSLPPSSVPFQLNRLSFSGKAEMDESPLIISVISSCCSLWLATQSGLAKTGDSC